MIFQIRRPLRQQNRETFWVLDNRDQDSGRLQVLAHLAAQVFWPRLAALRHNDGQRIGGHSRAGHALAYVPGSKLSRFDFGRLLVVQHGYIDGLSAS